MSAGNKKAQAVTRRARIEEMRRAEQARARRNKILAGVAITAILAATGGGGWHLWSTADKNHQAAEVAKAAPVKGMKTWEGLAQDHVQTKVDYPMNPAVGGDHHPVWAACDAKVYSKEVKEENAVHSLEHGAVWITYSDKAATADITELSNRVSATPYTFLSPYRGLSSPITLSAWGQQLNVDKASDPRVDQFLDKYVQGDQTPEKGATCSGGSTE